MSVTLDQLVAPAAPRFLGLPQWDWSEAVDVVVLGVPSGVGDLGTSRSARGGPAALRRASQVLRQLDDADGVPVGWYDYTVQRELLGGLRMVDAGDLRLSPARPLESLDHLPELLEHCLARARLVLVLGGDHSLTWWTSPAMPASSTIWHLDAHEDATEPVGPIPHAGNVFSYVEEAGHVGAILQLGLRGLVPARRRTPGPIRRILTGPDAFAKAAHQLASAPVLLSLDVDVIDPSFVSSVAAPSPLGMHPDEVLAAIRGAVSVGGPVRMIELVEYAPTRGDPPVEGFLLAQLALRLLSVCLEGA